MPGGQIAPDGRPTQAPGVGKNAKRHDLEGTPGLHDSSLQQGDVAKLEAGQRSQKQVQKAATPAPQGGGQQRQKSRAAPPDAIDFIGSRAKGTFNAAEIGSGPRGYDVEAWTPLMKQIASDPKASGPLTTSLLAQLSNINRQPREANVEVLDQNAADDAILASIQ